jgi:hypothetical protein
LQRQGWLIGQRKQRGPLHGAGVDHGFESV